MQNSNSCNDFITDNSHTCTRTHMSTHSNSHAYVHVQCTLTEYIYIHWIKAAAHESFDFTNNKIKLYWDACNVVQQ